MMKKYDFNVNKVYCLFMHFFCVFISITLLSGCQKNKEYIVLPMKAKPVIDGILDSIWLSIPVEPIEGDIVGALYRHGDEDLSANFRCGYYDNALYFFIDVTDDNCRYWGDTIITKNENDLIQLFFAKGNKKLSAKEMTATDSIFQLTLIYGRYKEETKKVYEYTYRYAQADTHKGYYFEVEVPIIESIYDNRSGKIGFNIEVRDNDNEFDPADGVVRGVETIINWSDQGAKLFWQQTKYYGDLILKDYKKSK